MVIATLAESPVHVPAASGMRARSGAVDLLRVAAVIPIVFYHAGVMNQSIALVGMHALIAAAVFFAAESRAQGTNVQIVTRRARRLAGPWLFFGLLHLALAIRAHHVQPWMFLIGGSVHLWFLPFIFVATCCTALLSRAGQLRAAWDAALAWSALSLGLILLEVLYTPSLVPHIPMWQFLNGTTAVLVALAAYCAPWRLGPLRSLIVAGVIALLCLPIWLPLRSPSMLLLSPAGAGTVVFLLVRMLPLPSNAVTAFLGRATLGIYVMHPLIQSPLTGLYCRVMAVRIDSLAPGAVVICSVITIMACLVIVAILERTPARWIVV